MRLSGVAVDAVMDSVSVRTTYRDRLAELGFEVKDTKEGATWRLAKN